MMIKIHGFPAKTKYQDVKILIKQECQITDFILDNLVIDTDGTKKVRIGLTDNSEGYRLMKSLDGYRMPGNYILKATPVSKAASNLPQQNAYDSRPGYQNQQTNNYSNAPRNDYMGQLSNDYNQGPHGAGVSHGLQATGMHGPGGSLGPRASLGGPGNMDTMNRLSPWASSGNNSNSWNSNPAMGAQVPQNSFGYNNQQANMNTGFGQQHQHHSDHLKPFSQGRGPPEQSFGYTPKNNVPDAPTRPVNTRHALRSIETVDTSDTHPPIHGRYPQSQSYQQDKPVTIMKDNFQGPTQYNLNNPEEHAGSHQSQYQSQAAPSPWQSQTQSTKSQYSKPSPTPYDKKYDDRKYSQLESRDSKNQPLRPETQDRPYKDYEKRQGFSPRRSLERRVSPSGRKASPSRRRVSPSGRRISPHSRKFSPTGKGVAPDWRTIPSHQTARHDDPHKRASPSRRLVSPSRRASPSRRPSPGRRDSPRLGRYSSEIGRSDKLDKYGGDRLDKYGGDRLDKYGSDKYEPEKLAKYGADKYDKYGPEKSDKYGEDKLKQVRPAYEPKAHASNQDIYSGGYRSDTRENTQYPIQGMREVEQRVKSWQRDRKEAAGHMKKQDSDRREIGRMHMERDRLVDPVVEAKNTLTTQRKSRSPMRRDRSPLRDRYKRQSPSTHSSRSPSRAWAQEKRRTSEIRDAPPPPTWPGKNVRDEEYSRSSRSNFPDRNKVEKTKHVPVWELNKDEDPRDRRPENIERRSFVEDNIRHTKGMPMREPLAHPSQSERFPQREREREPKFSPREDYDADRRDNYRRRDISPDRKPLLRKEDYESARRPREHEERPLQDDYHRRREASPRYDSRNDVPVTSDIDKDFEDIYKRALLFKKKAAELRRLSKKRDEFEEDDRSRIHHSEREGDDSERSHRFDDRDRFRDEEVMRSRERDDRARDERPHERSRLDDAPRRADYRPREDFSHQSDRNDDRLKRFTISPSIRIKRDKAIDDIANRIIDRHENYRQLQGEQRARVLDELKLAVARIVFDMFGDNDVSFIEIIIKFQAKYTLHDEEKILQDVMSSLPSQFRTIKRQGPEVLEVPIKTRRSQSPNLKPEMKPAPSPMKQRPSHQIMRRKQPIQKVIPPSKPVTKASPHDNKVVKPAVKKQEEEKKPAPPPAPAQQQSGHYELSWRMNQMVETELQDIMIKVWHELPDNPVDEAERLVVDKLRNKAGDDLRNVLGLNITKRLLNIHHPLYVKVQFSGKPEKVHLGEFLKKYNFIAFKRMEKTVNMFAAQVKTIGDFDRLCTTKDIRCGEIKVTVNPIYNFTKCPPNLVTSFYDQNDDPGDKITETREEGDKVNETKEVEKVPPKPKVEANTSENVAKVERVVTLPTEVNKTTENKTASKPVVDSKTSVNKPVVENKTVLNKPAIDTKTAHNKPAVDKPVNKPAEEKPTVKQTVIENKTAATKTEQKINVESKEVKKPPMNLKTDDATKKSAPEPVKTPTKTEAKPAPKTKDAKKNNMVENEYDELDDHDILALMSDGIILDECSGSEDE